MKTMKWVLVVLMTVVLAGGAVYANCGGCENKEGTCQKEDKDKQGCCKEGEKKAEEKPADKPAEKPAEKPAA